MLALLVHAARQDLHRQDRLPRCLRCATPVELQACTCIETCACFLQTRYLVW